MRIQFVSLVEKIRTSLWLVPSVMAVAAIGLASALIALDGQFRPETLDGLNWIRQGGASGARAVLSTVAGSMIGVAGVTFSVTMVALTLASSQFGPRLLRNFLADRGNQLVLGTFLATFLYCLIVLRSVRGGDEGNFVPHLAVTVGVGLAILSLGVLIYFIHHVSVSMQAESVIASVAREYERSLERLLAADERPVEEEGDEKGFGEDFEHRSRPVHLSRGGYLQAVDHDAILRLATEHDLEIQLLCRPGDFLISGAVVARAAPPERAQHAACAAVAQSFETGNHRTPTQDIEFTVHQLVEIGLRALSPGINDPFTAMACIDRLGDFIVELGRRSFPAAGLRDDAGRLRVVLDCTTFDGVVHAAFDQIRQASVGNVAVTIRLLETLQRVADRLQAAPRRAAIRRQVEMIKGTALDEVEVEADRQALRERIRGAETATS